MLFKSMKATLAVCAVQCLHVISMTLERSQVRRTDQKQDNICKVSEDPKDRPVVMVHSMPKTATSSVGWALELLGYYDCGSKWIMTYPSAGKLDAATDLVKDYKIGQVPDNVKSKVHELLKEFKADTDTSLNKTQWRRQDGSVDSDTSKHPFEICNSYSDYPLGHASGLNLNLKLTLWPDGQFIWIDRDFDSWHESYVSWEILKKGHAPKCSKDKLESFVDARRQEIVELQKLKPKQVLIVDLATTMDWDHLLPFLPVQKGCAPPVDEFPSVNVNVNDHAKDKAKDSLLQSHHEFELFDKLESSGFCK